MPIKSEAMPVTGHGDLWGCEIPHCLDNRLTDGGEVSLTLRLHSSRQNHFLSSASGVISVRG
jgi:hypothetical protein